MIRRLIQFAALPLRRKLLVFRSFAVMAAIRAKISLLPYSVWSRELRFHPEISGNRVRYSLADIEWAVNLAASYIPRATCLVAALAARRILAGNGRASELRLGVSGEGSDFAHAWLECEGTIVVGAALAGRYYRLSPPAAPAG